jgi:hypothetical protein
MYCATVDVLCDCSGFSCRDTTCALSLLAVNGTEMRTARAYAVFILPCPLCG